MVRIAHERIDDLFALAGREASTGHPELADRYVVLARKVGTRYNVRLRPEYRELYCRGCSTFWIEGRTVRTRLRDGRRTRTCLSCGRVRRTRIRPPSAAPEPPSSDATSSVPREDGALVLTDTEEDEPDDGSEEG
jgi:ribonuclease P protein subunit RPR2